MKKPSIDAIRRFKEQQERKKLEETERKIHEKLSTLEHRAAQGDRRAKGELRSIEKAKEERAKKQELQETQADQRIQSSRYTRDHVKGDKKLQSSQNGPVRRPKADVIDFDELMRLAANNNNELRREEKKPPSPPPRPKAIPRKPVDAPKSSNRPVIKPDNIVRNPTQPKSLSNTKTKQSGHPQIRPPSKPSNQLQSSSGQPSSHRQPRPPLPTTSIHQRSPPRKTPCNPRFPTNRPPLPRNLASRSLGPNFVVRNPQPNDYYDDEEDDYYDEEDEDDYEQDGFVVDEDDSDAQQELSKTLKSVFGYDKRRCDRREAELDQLYRQTGRVSTFEDLEREERRASRLASLEDAKALREEEERKRLKKLRLHGK